MSQNVILDETIEVDRPLHEVFAYVSEFSRIEEWDPAVASAEKTTPGAPGVGTEFRVDLRAGFSLHLATRACRAGSGASTATPS